MKILSKNLILFTLVVMILSLALRSILSRIFINQNFLVINLWAFSYFVLILLSGWYLSSREDKNISFLNDFFRYHFATYFSWSVISLAWFLLGYASEFEDFSHVSIPLIIWSSCIVLHFAYVLVFKRTVSKVS